jgi:hypothetical protein
VETHTTEGIPLHWSLVLCIDGQQIGWQEDWRIVPPSRNLYFVPCRHCGQGDDFCLTKQRWGGGERGARRVRAGAVLLLLVVFSLSFLSSVKYTHDFSLLQPYRALLIMKIYSDIVVPTQN